MAKKKATRPSKPRANRTKATPCRKASKPPAAKRRKVASKKPASNASAEIEPGYSVVDFHSDGRVTRSWVGRPFELTFWQLIPFIDIALAAMARERAAQGQADAKPETSGE